MENLERKIKNTEEKLKLRGEQFVTCCAMAFPLTAAYYSYKAMTEEGGELACLNGSGSEKLLAAVITPISLPGVCFVGAVGVACYGISYLVNAVEMAGLKLKKAILKIKTKIKTRSLEKQTKKNQSQGKGKEKQNQGKGSENESKSKSSTTIITPKPKDLQSPDLQKI